MWNVACIMAHRQHSKFVQLFFSARLIAYKRIELCFQQRKFHSAIVLAAICQHCALFVLPKLSFLFIRKLWVCVDFFPSNSAKRRCQKLQMETNAQWKTAAIDSCGNGILCNVFTNRLLSAERVSTIQKW